MAAVEPLISTFADDPVMAPIIVEFVAGLPDSIARLERAHAQGDTALVRRIGHQMKGAGAGYGFDEISKVGAQLEQVADDANGTSAKLEWTIAQLIDVLRRVQSPAHSTSSVSA